MLHNKEKELLAVLGLILSIGVWLVSMFYTYPQISNSGNPSVGAMSTLKGPQPTAMSTTDKEVLDKLLTDSKAYTDAIMTNLVIKHDYKSVYNYFDPATKQKYFENNLNKAYSTLKGFVGALGVASSYSVTNQLLSPQKDMMTVYYMVRYNRENDEFTEAAIELYIKITENKFSLLGIQQKPI